MRSLYDIAAVRKRLGRRRRRCKVAPQRDIWVNARKVSGLHVTRSQLRLALTVERHVIERQASHLVRFLIVALLVDAVHANGADRGPAAAASADRARCRLRLVVARALAGERLLVAVRLRVAVAGIAAVVFVLLGRLGPGEVAA